MKLNYNDIIYIEAHGHYTHLVNTVKNYQIKKSISQISNELSSPTFCSAHRSYIVNLKHVEKINKSDCLISNGIYIPVSRSNYKALNEAFINYYRGSAI